MFNTLLVVFWAFVYIFIAAYSYIYRKEKQMFMPLIAGMLNFSWEIHALIASNGYAGHIVWLVLDIFIIAYNVWILTDCKKRLIYISATAVCILILYFVFSAESINGMLVSSFIIDVIMALEFVAVFKKISYRGKLLIGAFRFLGDLFAWLENMQQSKIVFAAGIIVLLLNSYYLLCCVKEVKDPNRKSYANSYKNSGKTGKCNKKRKKKK